MKTAGTIGMLAMTVMFVWIANPETSSGQTWEYIYGHSTRMEDGKFRVIPVTQTCDCITGVPTDGYIAVGTSYPGSTDPQNSDVHVVRVDNNGARIWEYTYDITGNNDWDYGWSIIQLSDGSGFAITGETAYEGANDQDVFLLKIDCYGAVLWSKTYGGVDIVDGGRDLIEATTGNSSAVPPTSAGDIVIAGFTLGPGPFAGSPNGYLLRTSSTGALIWDAAYNYQPTLPPGDFDFFHALTEARRNGMAATGDIIAVGYTTNNGLPAAMQGLVVRVNGDNGAIGVAPQGAGTYGLGGGVDQFWSVVELQNPAQVGTNGLQNVVVTGDYGAGSIFAVKLNGGDPTVAPLVERSIGSPTFGTILLGRTVREITFAPGLGSVNQWQLVMTGTEMQAGGNNEMILLSMGPGNLNVGGLTAEYGGNTSDEEGWSVYPVNAVGGRTFGFVLCGRTDRNASDMYLVKSDGFGATAGCEDPLSLSSATVSTHVGIALTVGSIGLKNDEQSVKTCQKWGEDVCPWPSPGIHVLRDEKPELSSHIDHFSPGLLDNSVPAKTSELIDGIAIPGQNSLAVMKSAADVNRTLTVYPNPVKVGDRMRIACPAGSDATVAVSNAAGEIVMPEMKARRSEKGEMIVKTDGWSAGVYFITVMSDGVHSTIRAVVVD